MSAVIDESRLNVNIDKLHRYFQDILAKYFDGETPKSGFFDSVACYNCGRDDFSSEFVINRFRHVRCSGCGMVYVTPRLKETIAHDLYSEADYTEFYKIKLIPSIDYRRDILAVNKYRQIAKLMPHRGRVLDIGSGLGEVLSVFKENGWDCLGVEFNEFAAGFARERFGLNIINTSIYDFSGDEKFDVIMLWGVLEHFFSPLDVLKKARQLLNDDGLLLLEVPSADSFLVRYAQQAPFEVDRILEGDRHIMLFSIRALMELTAKAGFAKQELFSNGLDISTLNRLKLNGTLSNEQVSDLQSLLDESLQGDLLRGFFRPEKI